MLARNKDAKHPRAGAQPPATRRDAAHPCWRFVVWAKVGFGRAHQTVGEAVMQTVGAIPMGRPKLLARRSRESGNPQRQSQIRYGSGGRCISFAGPLGNKRANQVGRWPFFELANLCIRGFNNIFAELLVCVVVFLFSWSHNANVGGYAGWQYGFFPKFCDVPPIRADLLREEIHVGWRRFSKGPLE